MLTTAISGPFSQILVRADDPLLFVMLLLHNYLRESLLADNWAGPLAYFIPEFWAERWYAKDHLLL